MMGGTLEKKKRNLMDDLDREPWMDEPTDTWTPELHKEYKAFLERCKVHDEEREKMRKQLEQV
jgi:gluconate kinase